MATKQKAVYLVTLSRQYDIFSQGRPGRILYKCAYASGDQTVYAGDPRYNNYVCIFKALAANTVTITGWTNAPIMGSEATTIELSNLGSCVELRSDGSGWWVRNPTTFIR